MTRSTRRLLFGLVLAYAAVGALTALVYRGDLAVTAGAVTGCLLMLVLAVGVAWASNRSG